MAASYKGKTFKLFQEGIARVRYVIGECYWKVEIGEEAATRDFIAPPDMLSTERSTSYSMPQKRKMTNENAGEVEPSGSEINISIGTYVGREVIEDAFKVSNLPTTWKIAPNQPYPVDKKLYVWWGLFAGALLLLNVIFSSGVLKQKVDQFFFFLCLAILAIPICADLPILFSSRWQDSPYNPYASSESDDE
jgi:hypothetical protein